MFLCIYKKIIFNELLNVFFVVSINMLLVFNNNIFFLLEYKIFL